jgi:hypothetical protein
MREFSRVLIDGGRVVLVEPGGAHEHAAVSVDVMQRFGTLEKGMELTDVSAYAAGSRLSDCSQHSILLRTTRVDGTTLDHDPTGTSLFANHIFTLRKSTSTSGAQRTATAPRSLRRLRAAVRRRLAAVWHRARRRA